MTKDKEDFLKELLSDFKIEASEHLQAIVSGLLELEKAIQSPEKNRLIESVFRETHSMKGAARAVNLLKFERLCMSLEGVFHSIKNGTLELSKPMFDGFFQATDLVDAMLKDLETGKTTVSESNITLISQKLKSFSEKRLMPPTPQFFTQPAAAPAQPAKTEKTSDNPEVNQNNADQPVIEDKIPDKKNDATEHKTDKETLRVATSKLFEMLQMAEEMIAGKSELEFYSDQMHTFISQITVWRQKYEERLMEEHTLTERSRAEEFSKEKDHLKKIESALILLGKNLDQLQRATGRSIDDLILSIKKTLLQPFSSLFLIVPRIVRDLSKEYNKEISLELQGNEIEIDRRLLEEMKDPMIHLIRNCIDHGIETRKERTRNNKPEAGKLKIAVQNDTDQKIKIVIQDDGAGIDREKVIRSSVKAGIIKPEDAKSLSDKEVNMLIFASGVSTSPFITDVSGRGLGMAIVAEKISGIGGNIDVNTTTGRGTTFTITLPQTLTIFRGILVKASDNLFLIPTSSVIKAIKITPGDILTVESKNTLKVNDETIGIVSLADVLNIRKRHSLKKRHSLQALLLQHAQKKLIFIIEEVLGEHRGVVKSLGPQLKHVNNIAGASLLGNGKIAPVLNIPELLNSAAGKSYTENHSNDSAADKDDAGKPKHVLVAEDSITVRNMLRNYLESAGFIVKTAVDGQEAYEFLQAEPFDIVVSDVEMPRMNGFELTAKIREDLTFGHIPVILVTALETADDRTRGMEAGANAYIVKSSFEKSNLIETINRLI